MCGPSGSGKTTWVKNQMKGMSYPAAHISRDEIRFSMVREDEEFHRKAQEAIDGEPLAIFIDATHLSEKSRNATLDALNLENCELYAVNFEIPVGVCISQNDQRTGRAKVPRSVIRRMFYTYDAPKSEGEKYSYTVLNVKAREEQRNAKSD